MAAKSSEWRPGPTVCRCCLTEGCYKDISTEYFWMGKREVYAEMLKDTLDVSIAYSKAGGPNSNSRLICEPCISRLRDATEFKRQVVECERMFMQHLDPGSSSLSIDAEPEPLDKIKIESVKQEKGNSDDDFDDRQDFGMDDDDDDDDDDLDNQPLTKLASKVPKKESVDLLDLLDNTKAAEKRKATTKAKAPPPKKAKAKVEPPKPKPTSSKPKPEKKKKENDPLHIARRNAYIVIEFATAYPFRLPECSMVCVYCCESFDESARFRRHVEEEHKDFPIWGAFTHIPEGYIKADCTELACRLCSEPFDTLENVSDHLFNVHSKTELQLDHDIGIQPFKLVEGKLSCAICGEKYGGLRTLSRHTQTHFFKFTCESCGKSYSTASSLQAHMRHSHIDGGQRLCRKCKTTFKTLEDRRKHLSESPKCWLHLCKICGERFVTWNQKLAHQAKVHGAQKRVYVCPECKEVFTDRKKYPAHFKMHHAED